MNYQSERITESIHKIHCNILSRWAFSVQRSALNVEIGHNIEMENKKVEWLKVLVDRGHNKGSHGWTGLRNGKRKKKRNKSENDVPLDIWFLCIWMKCNNNIYRTNITSDHPKVFRKNETKSTWAMSTCLPIAVIRSFDLICYSALIQHFIIFIFVYFELIRNVRTDG